MQERAERRPRPTLGGIIDVSMITEGTYPHYHGGVSVWCDQVVRGMAPHRYEVHAVTTTGTERMAWTLPDNVTAVHAIPLWDTTKTVRPKRRLDPAIRRALRPFMFSISEGSDADAFVNDLEGLYEFAQAGALGPALLSEAAVDLVLEAMMATRLPAGRDVEAPPAVPTVADAATSLHLLEHLMRPLGATLPTGEITHAASNGAGVLLAMAAKWERGTPFLLTEHGIYLRERYIAYGPTSLPHAQRSFLLNFFKQLTAAAYRVADVIAPGSAYNRLWESANGAAVNKVQPIYNGIDALEFNPPATEPTEPTLAWVGRIDPLKDVKTLLRAFARVRTQVPNAKLRIFGAVPKGNEAYFAECQAVHEQLGLGDSCVFEGRVESIIDAYHAGHVLVSTSISEGFPYAVIEAMASGRAMIATDVGGVSEAIADTGILCPPRDDEAIAEACVQLLLDQPRRDRLAEAGRQRVLALFTLDICLEQYRQLYDTLREMPREPLARRQHARVAAAPVAPEAWPRPVAEAFAQSTPVRPSRRRLRPAVGVAR